MNNIRRCYEILGIEPGVSQDEIKQAYKDLAFVWHPDRYSHNPRLQQKAQDKLKEINYAYEFLNSYNSSTTLQANKSQSRNNANQTELEVNLKADYSKLENLLAANKWKEADIETKMVMLRVASREKEGWLRSEDVNKFPCQDLLALDQLWLKYSIGNFGFSAQKIIWHRLGCKADPWMPTQTQSECRFGAYVGWYVNNSWLRQWDDFSYNSQARAGSIPREYIFILGGWWSYSHSWTGYLLWGFDEVFLRLKHCKS
jgi:hypothetical protein